MSIPATRGPRSARVSLCTTTAILSAIMLTAGTPVQAQEVLQPGVGGNWGTERIGTNQPKASTGPSSCSNPEPWYTCIGHGRQTGSAGVGGGEVPDANYILSPGVDWTGTVGSVTAQIIAQGGRGGDGGDGGALDPFKSGYSNGGDAGNGGRGSAITFTQQGGSGSIINGADRGAVLLQGTGGAGGDGGLTDNGNTDGYGRSGKGGNGATGSVIAFTQDQQASIISSQAGVTAVQLLSTGGNGGNSPDAKTRTDHAYANAGGDGGNGGSINAVISGSVTSAGSGILAISRGANGGRGGFARSDSGGSTGGQGGNGGGGGGVLLVNTGSIAATGASGPATGETQTVGDKTITFSAPTAALEARVLGGIGGGGNGSGSNFAPGVGGNGGGVVGNAGAYVQNSTGTVVTTGYASAALAAQNIGGHGGNGSYGGGVFVAKGGLGATGGNAGQASVASYGGLVTTAGDDSIAMIAQSIGGGGGRGGNAHASGILVGVTVGGNSGSGGDGGAARAVNGDRDNGSSPLLADSGSVILTQGISSHAMMAQSIGGGGGVAGDADALVAGGLLAMAIGGVAGTGGIGGAVDVQNAGVLQTEGHDSYGMIGQSVGGGGGDGGAANSFVLGAQITAAVSVGGNGGTGGLGGTVTMNNIGQVVTNGANSFGMIGQSIGGGGGTGGTSTARTLQVYNDDEFPSVTLNTSLGGKGGSGGVGGAVTITNGGALLTTGDGSLGLIAQSIGGGGGTGGDASSLNQSFRSSTITATTTIGGNGGTGGNAGAVSVSNNGFINTAGDEASAIYAQSVGGGGGTGGSGMADSGSYQENETSLQVTVALGGSGGAAGNGNTVSVSNTATGILTYGNKSFGVFAQSVGGGGGTAGGGVAKGSGGKNNVNVAVGGGGGGGGTGGDINVNNDASILTAGGDSAAIHVQSVGGGGGSGGSATTGLGSSPQVTLAKLLADGMGIDAEVVETLAGLYELKVKGGEAFERIENLKKAMEQFRAENPHTPAAEGEHKEGSEININVGAGVAGAGGSAGNGGHLTVTNSADIETMGAASEGIFAQSVGGGGGTGGGATSASGSAALAGNVGLGGKGGASGSGGQIDLTNSGSIVTGGALSHGMFAQSIGGGGGKGGMSAGESEAFSLLRFNLGGDGGANGHGGAINLTNTGNIRTDGDDAIGILAQSLGGGGGLAGVMTLEDGNEGGGEESNGGEAEGETGLIPGTTLIPIALSGSDSSEAAITGDGGAVTVKLDGASITTQGRDAYGVLAQSVGGGGGLVLGVDGEEDQNFFGSNNVSGNGGNVTVNVVTNTRIETHGDGAVGILAQSIGGGGGLVGGMSSVDLTGPTRIQDKANLHHGTAGDVVIAMGADANIAVVTNGRRAHGIVAQAAGGGGGIFGLQDEAGVTEVGYFSPAGATSPNSGKVTIYANGLIQARGPESWGIWAQSRGNMNSAVEINFVDGVISGTAGGIYIENPTGTNSIFADGYLSGGNGIAIQTNGSGTLNAGRDGGGIVTITGDILSSGGGWNIFNNVSSRLYTGRVGTTTIQSNAFNNRGELWVGTNADRNMHITSDLTSTGRIILGVDFVGGRADTLQVDGTASIAGQILINPLSLPGSGDAGAYIVNAGSLNFDASTQAFDFVTNADGSLSAVTPYLHSYYLQEMSGGRLLIYAEGSFAAKANPSTGLFNANQSDLADHLQDAWEDGTGGALLTTLMASVRDDSTYVNALESMGAHSFASFGAARNQTVGTFAASMMSCPTFVGEGASLAEQSCAWARAGGGNLDRDRNDGHSGFEQKSYSMQVGGQTEVGDGWFIGGSLGYENSDLDTDAGFAGIDADSLLVGLFVKRQAGQLLVSGGLTGGLTWLDSSRSIVIGEDETRASASTRSQHAGAHAKLTYNVPFASAYLRPQLALSATYVHMNGFSETGSIYALDVEDSDNVTLSAMPSVELGARLGIGEASWIRPYVKGGVGFHHNRDWTTNAGLSGVGAGTELFDATVTLPDVNATIGAGMEMVVRGGFSLKLDYEGELASNYRNHRGFARLGYRF